MDRDKRILLWGVVIIALIIVGLTGICIGVGWYSAGVQAAVWRREGIELTTWEVFWGAQPATRTINLRNTELKEMTPTPTAPAR